MRDGGNRRRLEDRPLPSIAGSHFHVEDSRKPVQKLPSNSRNPHGRVQISNDIRDRIIRFSRALS
jgi:hypothetical protein